MKISIWWILAILVAATVAAAIFFNYFYIPSKTITHRKSDKYDIVTFKLPATSDPAIWGPRYWDAYFKLSDMIPCPSCKKHASPFMIFFKDIVNINKGAEIFDKKNFNKHQEYICKLPKA